MNIIKMIKMIVVAGCAALTVGLSGCVMVVTNPSESYQEHYQTTEIEYVKVKPVTSKRPAQSVKKQAHKPVAQSRPRPHEQTTKTDFNQVIEGWICKIQNREWFN